MLPALRAARSDNYELGMKLKQQWFSANLAAFDIKTRNELAVLTSSGGRAVYQNVAATRRRGAELEVDAHFDHGISSRLAYTQLLATVTHSYSTCVGLPCTPASVAAGSRLPAVPSSSLYASLTWDADGPGFSATAKTVRRMRIYANDLNSQFQAGYWIANLHVGWQQQSDAWKFSETVRIGNATNQRYVGSVIVNDSNNRFFEPEPGRTYYLLVTVAYR